MSGSGGKLQSQRQILYSTLHSALFVHFVAHLLPFDLTELSCAAKLTRKLRTPLERPLLACSLSVLFWRLFLSTEHGAWHGAFFGLPGKSNKAKKKPQLEL